MNILAVDDTELNLKLLRSTLEAEGHHVLEAANGLDALSVLEREPVDAIISDILMPKMDGYQFCHELRRSESFKHIAFIHYTSTYTSPADRQLSESVGADQYLTKPAETQALLDAVTEAIRRSGERRVSAPSASDPLCVMQEYNAVLVKKLEQRNTRLESALAALRQVHQHQNKWCDSLERQVQQRTAQLETSNRELTRALADVKELTGLLPICSYCKKVRDAEDSWQQLETYVEKHSHAQFSYGICPHCFEQTARPAVEKLMTSKTPQNNDARYEAGA
jgi:CheY-like chemotaxis protein